MSNLAGGLQAAAAQAPTGQAAPPLGPAPTTVEESEEIRKEKDRLEELRLIAQTRVENLSAMVFTQLMADEKLLNCFTKDRQIDGKVLDEYIGFCNQVSSRAAFAHAKFVWNMTIEQTQVPAPGAAPAPAEQK